MGLLPHRKWVSSKFVLQTQTLRSRYLLNPYIFLPSIALSTSSFENTLMLLAIMFACQSTPLFHLHLTATNCSHYRESLEIVIRTLFPPSFVIIIHRNAAPCPPTPHHRPSLSSRLSQAHVCQVSEPCVSTWRIHTIYRPVDLSINPCCWKLVMDTPNMGRDVRLPLQL